MAHDAIVIGGGIVGCAVAAHLAASGRSTLLLERTAIGAGASGRNSGVIQHPIDPVLVDLYRTSLELYRSLEPDPASGFVLGDRPAGLLMASLDAHVAEQLAADLAARLPAVAPTYLGPGEVSALEPAIDPVVSACRLDIGHPVGPLGATRAYATRARAAGVEVWEGVAARPWIEGGRVQGFVLEDAVGSPGDRLPARDVVVAAGPWSPALVDPSGAWQPIVRRWGVVVDTALDHPPTHVIEEAWIDIEPPTDGDPTAPDDEGEHAFSLVTAAGRSSVGSTFLADEPDGDAWVPALMEHGARFVPAIAAARPGAVRVCARPLSLDGRPLIGAVPGVAGLWIAAGHGPWGISTGPAAAPLLVDLLDGRLPAPPTALDPGRFGPVPLA